MAAERAEVGFELSGVDDPIRNQVGARVPKDPRELRKCVPQTAVAAQPFRRVVYAEEAEELCVVQLPEGGHSYGQAGELGQAQVYCHDLGRVEGEQGESIVSGRADGQEPTVLGDGS